MSEPVAWDPVVPPALRRVLQDLVESADPDDGGPLFVLAELLDVPTPAEWGYDAQIWVRSEIERLDAKRVYEFTQSLTRGGSPSFDKRVSDALASAGIDLEMNDGVFLSPRRGRRRARSTRRRG